MRVVAVVNAVTAFAGPVWRPVGWKCVSWTGVAIGGLEAALVRGAAGGRKFLAVSYVQYLEMPLRNKRM